MLYEAYQNKIKRRARVLAVFVRFLPLILALLITAAALATGYAVMKGMILDWHCSPRITYGETAQYGARTFFSEVVTQYREKGKTEWLDGMPTAAGQYEVRAAAKGVFGLRCGKATALAIEPKDITVSVSGGELLYGNALIPVGQTHGGDRIVCERYSFVRKSAFDGEEMRALYDVTPDTAHLRILDPSGADVSANYAIRTVSAELMLTRLPITVTVPDASFVYDGKAHMSEDFGVTEGTLCDGDSLEGDFTALLTDVGTVENRPTFRIVNAHGDDVTEYYSVQYIYGSLTVEKRPLLITTGSAEKVYDTKAVSEDSYVLDETAPLVDGHSAVPVGNALSFTDAGVHENARLFRVLDEKGSDVSENYDLQITAGTVTVKPLTLTVSTESASWEYDGKAHSASGYEASGLLEGHSIGIFRAFEMTDVGEYQNEILFTVTDAEGKDVTRNYAVDASWGICTVTPRPVEITTKSKSFVYDGTVLSHGGYNVDGLADGHLVQIVRLTEMTDVGSSPNIIEFIIRDATGKDVTFNYKLNISWGTLTVEPRPLRFITVSDEWMYDGQAHGNQQYVADGLAETHRILLGECASLTDVGSTKNRIEFSILDAADGDVTKNYAISNKYGTLTVTKRPIKVQMADGVWVYDGMAHSTLEFTITSEIGLAQGETLKVKQTTSAFHVGQSWNSPTQYTLTDAQSRSTIDNYHIGWVNGVLEITPRPVCIKPVDLSKRYDGTPLIAEKWEYTKDNAKTFIPWHTVEVVCEGSRTEIGQSLSSIASVRVMDGSLNVSQNYEIVTHSGTLTVYEVMPEEKPDDGPMDGAGDLKDDGFANLREPEDLEGVIIGRVKAQTSGLMYLRLRSYGDFNQGCWTEGPTYAELLPGGFNCNYLTSAALAASGWNTYSAEFEDMILPLLPYYLGLNGGGYTVSDNDVSHAALGEKYSVDWYTPPSGINFADLSGMLGEYEEHERAYAEAVYQNYLSVDPEMKSYMKRVIEKAGFSLSDDDIIKTVAAYVQSAAKYDPDYDRKLDGEHNIAYAFLQEYKSGVGRHFATVAVLLYRTLGIPARYVTGFVADVNAGEYASIVGEAAHAWVEVYVDTVGWVQVEVTSSEFLINIPNGSIGMEDEILEDENTLVVEPVYVSKVFDGTPLVPEQNALTGNSLFRELLLQGYTYRATVSGSQREVGQGESRIENFRLFDPNGTDVTDYYTVAARKGALKVFPADKTVISIYLHELQKYYDGTPLVFGEDDYDIIEIDEGVTVRISLHISRADVGWLTLSDLNADIRSLIDYSVTKDGADVTGSYAVNFVLPEGMEAIAYVPLRIDPRTVEFTAESAEKIYDGKLLIANHVFVSLGSLAKGHRVVARTEGVLTQVGETSNVITSVVIYDGKGNDVTKNYRILPFKNGMLTVTEK